MKAVYALTADPLTNGHLWVITTACRLFSKVYVSLGVHPKKDPIFSLAERLSFTTEDTAHLKNVEVCSYDGYTVEFAKSIGANTIIRGIRTSGDFEYEQGLREINEDIAPEIDTVYLIPPKSLAAVSSSTVKGLLGHKGWERVVEKYVPPAVYRSLQQWHQR